MSNIERHTDQSGTQRLLPVTECPSCGYDLRHLIPPARCSECGELIDEDMVQPRCLTHVAIAWVLWTSVAWLSLMLVLLVLLVYNRVGGMSTLLFTLANIIWASAPIVNRWRQMEPRVWLGPAGIISIDVDGERRDIGWQKVRKAVLRPAMSWRERIFLNAEDVVEARCAEAVHSPDQTWPWLLHATPRLLPVIVFRNTVLILKCTWDEAELLQQRLDEWSIE